MMLWLIGARRLHQQAPQQRLGVGLANSSSCIVVRMPKMRPEQREAADRQQRRQCAVDNQLEIDDRDVAPNRPSGPRARRRPGPCIIAKATSRQR